MSASDSSSTWSTLLEDLQPSHNILSVHNERLFHRAFKQICADVRERDPQRLLAKFLRHHDKIIAFIGALDESTGFDESRCLGSLFWSIALTTIQAALTSRQKDILFRDYFPTLNEILPSFGAELPAFPDVLKVQRPLQRVFSAYIDCYTKMLIHITSRTAPAEFENFVQDVHNASLIYTESKLEWKEMVKEAAEELEANRLVASQPSFPNGTLGPLSPHTTRASFDWLETLGHGTYGQVSKVRETSTGTIYAQKVIRITDPRSMRRVEREVQNEVAIMQKLRHHHIASVQFHVREGDIFSIIMLPVADYDLLYYLQQRCIDAQFPRTEITHLTSWFGCLVGALAFAHSKHVKHEDIKPSNILIKDHQPYLADFGCAKDFSEQGDSTSMETLTFGTPVYWAPESPPRGRKADVFSLGCVFTEMLTVRQGRTLEDYQIWRHVPNRDNGYAFRENLSKVAEWLRGLINLNDYVGTLLLEQTVNMLKPDYEERANAKDIKRALRVEGDDVYCSTCW